MGYFYAGAKTNQRTNAYAKMGESNQKYLSNRVSAIRAKEGNFVVLKYLEIPNSTQAVTRAIEGHVRFMLERKGYKNVQNDHFVWSTTPETKMSEYIEFATLSMQFAKDYCNLIGIDFIEHEGNPNARRTCRRK